MDREGTELDYQVKQHEMIAGEQPPFASCHASTLVRLPGGDILAAWFAGTREGHPDVDIWMARRSQGKWSEPYVVAGEEGIAHWNPVLFAADGGKVLLFYKKGHKIRNWFTMLMESFDEGRTWTEPKELVQGDIGGRGPVRNKPIVLSNGHWAAPASVEDEFWDAFVDLSQDEGMTWTPSSFISIPSPSPRQQSSVQTDQQDFGNLFRGKGIIQPTLWESRDSHVHMLLRSTEGRIYRSDSEDQGQTWCPAYPTELPNNNSAIDLVSLAGGTLALVFNPVEGKERSPLVVRLSEDDGTSWGMPFILENEEGEFSYPAIIAGDENDIHITYTWNRKNIAYWHLGIRSSKGE